jgi:hypothetical protein
MDETTARNIDKERQENKMNRLGRWAAKNPEKFYFVIERLLEKKTRENYKEFARLLDNLANDRPPEQGWTGYSRIMTRSPRGFARYLRIYLVDLGFFEIIDRAKLDRKRINELIQKRAEIVYMTGTPAEVIYSPKDKVSNELWGDSMKIGLAKPVVTGIRKGKKYGAVCQYVRYTDPEHKTQVSMTVFNHEEYERVVSDAVISLVQGVALPVTITNLQIYRAVTRDPHARLSAKASKEIEKTMLNLRRGEMTIITDPSGDEDLWKRGTGGKLEPEKKLYANVKSKYFGSLVLCSASSSGEFGGTLDRWKIYEAPVLYCYAHDKNQVASAPIAALPESKDQKQAKRRGKDIQTLYSVITRRIDTMKKAKSTSRNMTWESLYELDGVYSKENQTENALKLKKSRTRGKVIKILDECKASGLIAGYTYNAHDNIHMKKKGKRWEYYAIEIIP